MSSAGRFRRTIAALSLLIAGVGFLPTPAQADGFGWYAYFFDYDEFVREYRDHFSKSLKGPDLREILPEFRAGKAGSAFELLDLMEESGRVKLLEPKSTDGELLWAEALQEFGRELEKRNPQSAGRFLATGRQFLGLENMPACRETYWIHGACGSAVIYTPAEVAHLSHELGKLVAARINWSRPEMRDELLRFCSVIDEAAAQKRAIFFYGHD